ncbi:LssY C-terminal domain-containing protein [Vibrio penaeicida]|uniref:LssY C-terminal domain-containing protein n=1 Tax=Vibrio penaeicida TaxID=104609 RepID=UPI001F2CF93E|nr:LssY C-terminal domain-containing protein [Vibrio penaeicida]
MLTLFLGALLDGLIGPNLIVMGEPFLLSAGYLLQQGSPAGVLAVLLGALVGDQCSYFIGWNFGYRIQRKLIHTKPSLRRVFARARLLMHRKGAWVITFARLLGPVAWVVPFIAGGSRVSWRRFTLYDSIGVFIGVGQFVFWGYLISYGLESFELLTQIQVFVKEHIALISLLSVVFVFSVYWIRKFGVRKSVSRVLVFGAIGLLGLNYYHFFIQSYPANKPIPSNHRSLARTDFNVYPGRADVYDAQAINLVFIGESPHILMNKMGWIKNRTFSRNQFKVKDYLSMLDKRVPPVSDLYWKGEPQWLAYQLPGDLLNRSHVRWWNIGVNSDINQPVWLGAISYDAGLKISHYNGIVTLLHKIDPNVDQERDRFAEEVELKTKHWESVPLKVTSPSVINESQDYYSDGFVSVIQPKSLNLATAHILLPNAD